jgi:maltooligosyltrehalose trehalohydrolase
MCESSADRSTSHGLSQNMGTCRKRGRHRDARSSSIHARGRRRLVGTDHQDPELARAVSKGRQEQFSAFGWNPEEIPDPQAVETFRGSKLKWEEKHLEPHRSILEWHRKLIRLRRTIPALTDGRLDRVQTFLDEKKKWLLLLRGSVTVACNLASETQQIQLQGRSPYTVLLSSDLNVALSGERVSLPPDSVAILGSS